MSSDRTLGDIAEIVMGQSPSGDTCNEVGNGIPLLNGPTEFGSKHPHPVQFTSDAKKVSLPGDLLFCVRGSTTGRMNWADQRYAIGRGLAAIRGRDGYPNSFVRAVIEASLEGLLIQATGSTFPNVSRDLISSLPIPSVTPASARVIASIVEPLDDRIALLRETNATLEAIAQALFKSWFVDFDPVRAKQAGRAPEGMSDATAALFPSSFEESELGLVPKGWWVCGIDETCELGRGSSPRPIQKFMGGDVPWIKIADATASDGMYVFETKEMIIKEGVRNSVEVRPGDLIMSNSASCGITVFVELYGCIHDGWLYFKNYQHISKYFLFFWLRKIADHLVHIADGSVQKNLNIALVSSQKIVCPSMEVVRAFDNLAGPLLDRVRENCVQAQTLASLRDTLLPRLISGQLRLPEAKAIVEAAT